MRTRFAVIVLCAAFGCAHHPPPAAAPVALPWYGDLRALAEEAARARGLTLTRRFDVTPLDEPAFLARYAQLGARRARELGPGLATLLRVFHLAERTAPTALATQSNEV